MTCWLRYQASLVLSQAFRSLVNTAILVLWVKRSWPKTSHPPQQIFHKRHFRNLIVTSFSLLGGEDPGQTFSSGNSDTMGRALYLCLKTKLRNNNLRDDGRKFMTKTALTLNFICNGSVPKHCPTTENISPVAPQCKVTITLYFIVSSGERCSSFRWSDTLGVKTSLFLPQALQQNRWPQTDRQENHCHLPTHRINWVIAKMNRSGTINWAAFSKKEGSNPGLLEANFKESWQFKTTWSWMKGGSSW